MESSEEKQLANSPAPETTGPATSPVAAPDRSPSAHSIRNEIRVWTRDLLIAIGLALVIIVFLYQPVKVEGTSMAPLLSDQERIFINKFVYRFEKIERGDVVVFYYPRDPEKSYIKRVIALPGDQLQINHGQVLVNGKPIAEPYVPRRFVDGRSLDAIVIPDHEYFVMGDHRSISSDSRDFGPVERRLIYGKAAFVYWPTEKMGVVH